MNFVGITSIEELLKKSSIEGIKPSNKIEDKFPPMTHDKNKKIRKKEEGQEPEGLDFDEMIREKLNG